MSKFGLLLGLVAAGLIAALVGAARPAHATYPGATGRITFTSDRSGGTDNVFTMRSDGSDVKQLTFLSSGQGFACCSAWSADGHSLGFVEGHGSGGRLYLMNADGSNQHLLMSEDAAFTDNQPSFSPDGTRVIFARCENAIEECAIYTVKTDGHGLNAITHFNQSFNVFDLTPKYAPDGNTIAMGSFHRDGVNNGVYLMDPHGNNIRLITPTALEGLDPDWSPDGSTIAFDTNCCNPQPSEIWTVRPDGSNLQQLTSPGTEHDFLPTYSPQGDKIAFERDVADFSTGSILTMNTNGTGQTTIQTDAFQPNWGPNGS